MPNPLGVLPSFLKLLAEEIKVLPATGGAVDRRWHGCLYPIHIFFTNEVMMGSIEASGKGIRVKDKAKLMDIK